MVIDRKIKYIASGSCYLLQEHDHRSETIDITISTKIPSSIFTIELILAKLFCVHLITFPKANKKITRHGENKIR